MSVTPVSPVFYVGAALEGSRYLYLAMAGWAAILVVTAAEVSGQRRFTGIVATIVMLTVALAAYGTRVHLRPWVQASALRELVLAAAAADKTLVACDPVFLQGLPESVQGAYLFSNGAREAFAGIGLNAYVRGDKGPCSFRWDDAGSRFEPATPAPPIP